MKFEDLKLPEWENSDYQVVATNAARAIYDQMHAHYEAKLAEAKPEPEELFEHPDMPGKRFRRLKVGEVIQHGDWAATKGNPPGEGFLETVCAGLFVESGDANYFYREVPQPAPERRWPWPPPVEYVPLGPEDVTPGSAVRSGKDVWYMVECVEPGGVVVRYNNTIPWQGLVHYEILRPNSTTWEPCKKPKA